MTTPSIPRPLRATPACLLALLLLRPLADAAFFVQTFESDSKVYSLNPDTGASVFIGDSGVQLTDLALTSNGSLFGAGLTSFYSLDGTTAAATLLGSYGPITTSMVGLDFGPAGLLYGVSGAGQFLQVNPATGAATLQFNTPFGYIGDVAHFGGDLFYATDNQGGQSHLIAINAATSSAVDLGLIASGEICPGLDFDPTTGRLIVFAVSGRAFDVPNFATSGSGTLLSTSVIPVAGATSSVPEPCSLLLLALATPLLLRRRRSAPPVV